MKDDLSMAKLLNTTATAKEHMVRRTEWVRLNFWVYFLKAVIKSLCFMCGILFENFSLEAAWDITIILLF